MQKFSAVVLLDKIYAILRSVLRPQYAGLSLASILTGVFVAFLIQPIENSFLKIGVLAVVGILISLLCVITWKMGFRLAKINARRELIGTLCDSDEAIILAKSDGKVICDTAAFRQLISTVDPGDLLGLTEVSKLAEKITPATTPNFLRLKESAVIGRRVASEIEIRNPDGKQHFWRVSVDPVGTLPDLSVWTFVDVTAQKEFEANREDEQKFIFDLLDELPVGFFSAAQDGTLQYINKTLADWLSIGADRNIGSSRHYLADFLVLNEGHEHQPAIDPDESGMHAGLQLKNSDGETFSSYLIQSQKENKKGEFMYSRSVVLREPFTPIVDDGTGGALLRRIPWLFSDSPVGIVLLDLHGVVIDCNRFFLKILGLHRHGVIGRPISDMISKQDRDSANAALAKVAMKTMRAVELEVRAPADGEREITASFSVSGIENSDAEVTGLVLHVNDTTNEQYLDVRHAQAQKMQAVGQLAGGVAHDFNNLLTAMGGFCDLLLSRHGPDDPDFSDIMQIKQNAKRAGDLVRQLLAFSRRQTLQHKIFSITDSLSELSNMLRRLIGENIELNLIHGKGVDLIRTDPSQFQQVVINLAVNARDAMPGGGTITITTKHVSVENSVQRDHDVMPAGEYIRINVADTGSGIAQEDITRIWEPFFSTKDVGEGTGLGLSMVYGIIRQSDGYIFLGDSAIGDGTTFEIYLPAYSAAEVKAIGGEIAGVGDPELIDEKDLTGEATVLLVEDEDAVRVFGARALKNKGYRVLEAEDGERALDVINGFGDPIDLIITDVMMPGMDGHTLVRLVQEELPNIKVILMSGYAEDAIPGEIAEDGGINFLPKPFSLRDLAGKVKEVMAS